MSATSVLLIAVGAFVLGAVGSSVLTQEVPDAGMFACEDGYSHSMENTGEEPAGLFVIEFKGAEELP